MADCIEARRASPRIERQPSARGPNSIRPWNQPTIAPSAKRAATRSSIAASSRASNTAPCASSARRISASENSGPSRLPRIASPPPLGQACRTGVAVCPPVLESYSFASPAWLRCHASRAAPSAPPASPAAGWIQRSSNTPARCSSPLATQFSATPPARQRRDSPVTSRACRARRSIASLTTFCTEAATSMCRCSNGDSGGRGGPPSSRSNRRLVMLRPLRNPKQSMFNRNEPSGFKSIMFSKIASANRGSPYGARPINLYSPELTRNPQYAVNAE